MPADVNADILINAVGGDSAAAEVDKASNAIRNLGNQQKTLRNRFQSGFTNIALYTFMRDSSNSIGLGRETIRVIGLMDVAIQQMAAAIGIAEGPVLLIGSALLAFVAITEKVISKNQAHAASLKDLFDAEDKEITSLGQSILKTEEHIKKTGDSSKAVRDLLTARKQLAQFEAQEEIQTIQRQITSLQQQIEEEEKERKAVEDTMRSKQQYGVVQAMTSILTSNWLELIGKGMTPMAAFKKTLDDNAGAMFRTNVQLQEAKLRLEQLIKGQYDAAGAMEAAGKSADQLRERYKVVTNAIEELQKKQEQYSGEANALNQDEYKKKLAEVDNWERKEIDAITTIYNKAVQTGQLTIQLEKQTDDAILAVHADADAKRAQIHTTMYTTMQKASDTFSNNFYDAVSKMMVEGQSFTKSMDKAFQTMAEDIINWILKMITEWTIFQALTGLFGMPAGPVANFMGIRGFASGGSMSVNRPTLFLAGEGGEPESVNVTPLSRMGSTGGSGGGSGTVVYMDNNFEGITDPDEIARVLGDKLAERIRGRGDIAMSRSS